MRRLHCTCLVILATASCLDTKIIRDFLPSRRISIAEVIPAPIVIPPSQFFDGIDGSWSTFMVRIGTPPQSVKVLASTNSPDTIVVRPEGCAEKAIPKGVPPNCASARGGTFNSNLSATWSEQGWYGLNGVQYGFEANLGYKFNLEYGMDKLGLGFEDGDAPVLENQTIAGYNLPNFLYMGLFGLGTQPIIYSTYGNFSPPSYFVSLRNQSLIPSLSWSYTAGASYRYNAGEYAQLIFGGYDSSRFQPNDVNFRLGADVTRDIVVGIQSIVYSGETTQYLLPDPIYAFVESTDPNIWLPPSACSMFEHAFSLQYDNNTDKYLINNTQFAELSAKNPSVSFRLAASTTGGSTVDISLPFKAFGLKAEYPFVPNATYYFPLKRAVNSTQYTLGRTFLQEAYLTVDYDRRNFSISQCTWVDGVESHVVPILDAASYPTNITNTTIPVTKVATSKRISSGPIVGGVIGGLALISSICAIIFWYIKKKKEKHLPPSASMTLEDLKHPDTNKIFCNDAESEQVSIDKKAVSLYTVHSRYAPDGELAASGHEIYQLSAESRATELGDTDTRLRYELQSTLPIELAGDHYFGARDEDGPAGRHLSPLAHQNSIRSIASTTGLLDSKSPVSRETSRAGPTVKGPVSPIATPVLSPRISDFGALHDRPAG